MRDKKIIRMYKASRSRWTMDPKPGKKIEIRAEMPIGAIEVLGHYDHGNRKDKVKPVSGLDSGHPVLTSPQ